jgi:hypothetical protein
VSASKAGLEYILLLRNTTAEQMIHLLAVRAESHVLQAAGRGERWEDA